MASQVIDIATWCEANLPDQRLHSGQDAMVQAVTDPVVEVRLVPPTRSPFFTDGWAIEDDIRAERLARSGE